MTALLIDLDGVLYVGNRPLPGAREVVAWLDEAQVPHLFLTNTTSRPRNALVDKLARLDLPVPAERILTPPVVAVQWLREHAPGPTALFVRPETAGEFDHLPRLAADAEDGAASVVMGDLGEGWSYAVLNRAFRLLMGEPPPALVALGMTRYWRAPGGLQLDVGAFVSALEYAAGREAVVLGKPATPFFAAAVARLDATAEDTVMVGDDIVGDVGGAQRAGLHGVLVRTGKFRDGDLDGEITPDAVLDDIGALPSWWELAVGR